MGLGGAVLVAMASVGDIGYWLLPASAEPPQTVELAREEGRRGRRLQQLPFAPQPQFGRPPFTEQPVPPQYPPGPYQFEQPRRGEERINQPRRRRRVFDFN
jgi:hypothetical protein